MLLGVEPSADAPEIGRLLAQAFPDRIGLRRRPGDPHYLLSGGHGAILSPGSVVRDAEWLVTLDANDKLIESLAARVRAPPGARLERRLSAPA